MATKVFCDGCDTELTAKTYHHVELDFNGSQRRGPEAIRHGRDDADEPRTPPAEFDLCGRCLAHWRKVASPRTWERHKADGT